MTESSTPRPMGLPGKDPGGEGIRPNTGGILESIAKPHER